MFVQNSLNISIAGKLDRENLIPNPGQETLVKNPGQETLVKNPCFAGTRNARFDLLQRFLGRKKSGKKKKTKVYSGLPGPQN